MTPSSIRVLFRIQRIFISLIIASIINCRAGQAQWRVSTARRVQAQRKQQAIETLIAIQPDNLQVCVLVSVDPDKPLLIIALSHLPCVCHVGFQAVRLQTLLPPSTPKYRVRDLCCLACGGSRLLHRFPTCWMRASRISWSASSPLTSRRSIRSGFGSNFRHLHRHGHAILRLRLLKHEILTDFMISSPSRNTASFYLESHLAPQTSQHGASHELPVPDLHADTMIQCWPCVVSSLGGVLAARGSFKMDFFFALLNKEKTRKNMLAIFAPFLSPRLLMSSSLTHVDDERDSNAPRTRLSGTTRKNRSKHFRSIGLGDRVRIISTSNKWHDITVRNPDLIGRTGLPERIQLR